jgi:hypothetical protein
VFAALAGVVDDDGAVMLRLHRLNRQQKSK